MILIKIDSFKKTFILLDLGPLVHCEMMCAFLCIDGMFLGIDIGLKLYDSIRFV